jgi:TnpA family transposase
LNDAERNEYFTFNKEEIKILKSFKQLNTAVYFAISLVFFKLKYTLVNFSYRDVTRERQHVMRRYFPYEAIPRNFPTDKDMIARIGNKVLATVGFSRFRGEVADKIISILQKQAIFYPRQRQLCKALLNLFLKNHIAIPGITTVQDCVTQIWNCEFARIRKTYHRYTSKSQRQQVLALLEKTDDHHRIVSIRKDMKQFTTTDIDAELEKHIQLKAVFFVAKDILPKLQLPTATINYYAELINYYNGARLKQLNADTIQLYLLCYSYSRFQIINDNLLEAFKKRTLDYVSQANEKADLKAAKFVDELKIIRQKVHDLLMAIKYDKHKTHIPKSKLFKFIPEPDLVSTAQLLLSDNLDKDLLFWRYIDQNAQSITLNLRPIFLNLDITIVRNDVLKAVVAFMKKHLEQPKTIKTVPKCVEDWIPTVDLHYIIIDDVINTKRLEFLFYKQLAHHIDTNKLTLQFSVKHKEVEDNFIALPKWNKDRSRLLRSLPYTTLQSSPTTLLAEKEHRIAMLYKAVNANIRNGNNPDVILKPNKHGNINWRLRPLEKAAEPNEGLLSRFQKRSIVDVMYFVNDKIKFSRAFESILPRSTKQKQDWVLTSAVILANALRIGTRGMANVCDLNLSALLTAENAYVRMETLTQATHLINLEAEKLDIFKQYNIDGKCHASLDGLKIGTRIQNIAARHSPKFLGQDAGVSAYNVIFNHFSLASRLISANEYEGNFTFEIAHHQNTQAFKLERVSTDKHGMNTFNFGLFDLIDQVFAPRIPKPHNETLWGFGQHKDYRDLIIRPDKMINKNHIINHWDDDMLRMVVSILTGDAIPSIVIGKMSSQKYRSKTKLAFTHYNHIVRSEFILQYINDKNFRRSIECALNRGEAYNNLYRAITLLNGGKFRGQSETEMMIWNQCSRLVAAVILYYNAYILNYLYVKAKTQEEKELIIALSPGAWEHINLLGYYQFCGLEGAQFIDQLLAKWNWQQSIKNG